MVISSKLQVLRIAKEKSWIGRRTVGMLPHILRFKRIEDIFPAQQTTDSTRSTFDLVRAFGGEFLTECDETIDIKSIQYLLPW